MSLLLCINVMTICFLIECLTSVKVINYSNLSTWAIGVAVSCLVLNYFALVYKVDFKKSDAPENHVADTSNAVYWYIGLTMAIFGLTLMIWSQ